MATTTTNTTTQTPKKYTIDQLKNVKLADLENDGELLNTIVNLYGGGSSNPSSMLNYWKSGYRNFQTDLNYALGSINPSPNAELVRNVDRYINWNNPNNPKDQQASFSEREKALKELNSLKSNYESRGIDITSADWFKTMIQQLGETAGGGQTSAQTAQQIESTKANQKVWTEGGKYSMKDATGNIIETGNKAGAIKTSPQANYAKMDGLQLFKLMKEGKLTASKTDPTWSGMYINGQATEAQKQAWDMWTKQGGQQTAQEGKGTITGQTNYENEANRLFELIKSGKLSPSKTDPTWTSMYQDGQATEAQKKAWAMWQDYANKGLNNSSKLTTIDEANDALNKYQAGEYTSSTDGEESMVRGFDITEGQDSKSLFAELFNEAETTRPEYKSQTQMMTELRDQYGISDLESELNDLKAQAEEIEAQKRLRQQSAEGKQTSMSVISGRVSEIERQENERLDAINRQINAKYNEYQTKNNVVQMMMSANNTDYQNAVEQYNQKYNQRMQMINVIKGYEDEAKSDAEKAQDTARANLNIAIEAFKGKDFDSLSTAQQAQITALATQAGVPTTLLDGLIKESKNSDILYNSTRTGSDGYEYMDIIMRDPNTGKFTTESVRLGQTSGGQPTPNQLLEAEKEGYEWTGDKWVNTKDLEGIFYLKGGKYGPGVQCGEGYNKLTDGPKVGHTYDSKIGVCKDSKGNINHSKPSAGQGMAIPIGGSSGTGHMATVLDSSEDYDYQKGTGSVRTVEYNRYGKGELSFQTYTVADLKKKYGANWGFTNSTFNPTIQNKLSGYLNEQTADDDYMNKLVQEYLNGASEDQIQEKIKNKFTESYDQKYYLSEFDEVIKTARTEGINVGNLNSSPQQEKVTSQIMADSNNYAFIINNLGKNLVTLEPVFETEDAKKPFEYDVTFKGNTDEIKAKMNEIIKNKYGVTLTSAQLTKIFRDFYSQLSSSESGTLTIPA